MRKFLAAAVAVIAVSAMISSVTVAHAKGGRTTAQDCEPGSPDPDCPDEPPPTKGQTPAPPPK